ncbi:MAG: hypothetical protein MUC50_05455 [Myxococcota bacterium]|jgi:ATP-dependent DNA helicase RecG|nr:hypothetical protein [Myxococcota bacterium]
MERDFGYLERGRTGRGTDWRRVASVRRALAGPGDPDRDRRTNWEAAKTGVLSTLRQRAERGKLGLSNKEIRLVTLLDRNQVFRVMQQLRAEAPRIVTEERNPGARYKFVDQ